MEKTMEKKVMAAVRKYEADGLHTEIEWLEREIGAGVYAAVTRLVEEGALVVTDIFVHTPDCVEDTCPMRDGEKVRDPDTGRTGTFQRGRLSGEPGILWSDTGRLEVYYEGRLERGN